MNASRPINGAWSTGKPQSTRINPPAACTSLLAMHVWKYTKTDDFCRELYILITGQNATLCLCECEAA